MGVRIIPITVRREYTCDFTGESLDEDDCAVVDPASTSQNPFVISNSMLAKLPRIFAENRRLLVRLMHAIRESSYLGDSVDRRRQTVIPIILTAKVWAMNGHDGCIFDHPRDVEIKYQTAKDAIIDIEARAKDYLGLRCRWHIFADGQYVGTYVTEKKQVVVIEAQLKQAPYEEE